MKKRLLDLLICPTCQSPELRLTINTEVKNEIEEGCLDCGLCHSYYPIVRGVPRFVKNDSYVENFSLEWNRFSRTQFDRIGDLRSTTEFFGHKTKWSVASLKDRLVLDAGCGGGRYMDVALRAGAEVVGVDLSYAVDNCYRNIGHHEHAHILQTDLLSLPFRQNVFDKIYSIGVIHHTPKPREAFTKLLQFLKNSGEITIWVYEYSHMTYLKDLVFRKTVNWLPFAVIFNIAKISNFLYPFSQWPLIGKIIHKFSPPFNFNADPDWRVLDTFDWLTPKYQSLLKREEIKQWFIDGKLALIYIGDPGITASGKKF